MTTSVESWSHIILGLWSIHMPGHGHLICFVIVTASVGLRSSHLLGYGEHICQVMVTTYVGSWLLHQLDYGHHIFLSLDLLGNDTCIR